MKKSKFIRKLLTLLKTFEMQLFLGWVLAVHAFEILMLPSLMIPTQTLSEFSLTDRFLHIWLTSADTIYYMQIAAEGYKTTSFVFFPLWPLVLSLFGAHPIVAKTLSIVCSGIFIYMFVRLLTLWKLEKYTKPILLALVAYPFSFMLLTPMSEPLFMLLSALTFYFFGQRKWLKGSLSTAAVTATRMIGIVLIVYAALKLAQSKLTTQRKILYALISVSGLGCYMLYLKIVHGNFLLFYQQEELWNRRFGMGSIQKLFSDILAILVQLGVAFKPHPIDLLHFAALPLSVLLLIYAWKKLDRGIWLYCLLSLIVPLASGTFLGMPRYLLGAFPLFIGFGFLYKKVPFLFYMYVAFSLMLQAWLMIRFFNYEMVA